MANHKKKYTGRHMAYVRMMVYKKSFSEIAADLGVTPIALKKRCHLWRSKGYRVPKVKGVDVGSISTRMRRGKPVKFIKTEAGWSMMPGQDGKRGRKQGWSKDLVKPEMPVVKSYTTQQREKPKKIVKVFSTRVHEAKVPFYIKELRMTVYVSPDAKMSDIRAKYIGQRDHNRKTVAN